MDTCCCRMCVLELFFLSTVDTELFWMVYSSNIILAYVTKENWASQCANKPQIRVLPYAVYRRVILVSLEQQESLQWHPLSVIGTSTVHTGLRDFWILCHLLPKRAARQRCYHALQTLPPVIANNWHNSSENSERVVIWLADKMLDIVW